MPKITVYPDTEGLIGGAAAFRADQVWGES